jgi:hypothetical protein
VYVKADLDFASPTGQLWTTFYYSLDGLAWHQLGGRVGPQTLDGSLAHFMGHRVGLFNYATQQVGGRVDFDYYLLSETLTAQGLPLDWSDLDAAIAHAATLVESDYPQQAWAEMRAALSDATAVRAGPVGTQNQIDAPERALSYQLARLAVVKTATPELPVTVTAQARCVAGNAHVAVRARNDHDAHVGIALQTAYGERTFSDVAPGANAYQSFNARTASTPAGSASIRVTGTVNGTQVTTVRSAEYPGIDCAG